MERFKRILIIIIFYGIPTFSLLFGVVLIRSYDKSNDTLKTRIESLTKEESVYYKEQKLRKYLKELNIEKTTDYTKIKEEAEQKLLETNNQYNQDYSLLYVEKLQYNSILEEKESLVSKYNRTISYRINNISTINQYPKYPNGCEAVALTILLNYYGANVTVDKVIDVMPKGPTLYYNNNILYGGDPNYEFLGDPKSRSGWGIWDKGLAITANNIKSGVINSTGSNFDEIIKLVYHDKPVVVWTSINLKTPYVAKQWISTKTGQTITWKNYNHALVVIGYTSDSIIVSDPINGKIRYFNKAKFINVYNYMGKKSIHY